MKRSWLVVLVLAIVVVGVLYYARASRFDRLAARASAGPVGAEDWDVLRERKDDPRVIAAAAVELREAIELPECEAVERIEKRAGAVLDAHPTTDDESLGAIAKMIAVCSNRRPLKWTKRAPEDLVKAMRKDLAGATNKPADLVVDALVEAGPRLSQDVVDVIVSAVKPNESKADALLASGLPENGEKLVAANEHALRRPSGGDERVSAAVRAWLGSLKTSGPTEQDALAIGRAAKWAPPARLDEPMAEALAKTIEKTDAVKTLCAKLVVHPEDAGLLLKHATGPAAKACAAPAQEMKGALDMLNATAAAATQFEDETGDAAKQRRDAWEEEQADAIVKLGSGAMAAAREGLKSNQRTVRRVSARAFAKLDRKAYAVAIAERLRAHAANADDAKLVLELLALRGPFEATGVLATFYTGDVDVVKRATAVLKREKPDAWVAPLFASLSVQVVGSPGVLKGYREALEQTAGAGALAGNVLDAALVRAGRPEGVPWPTKMLALMALKKQGNASHVALVEKLTTDKTSYPVIKLRNENFTGEIHEESRTNRTIGELATETLAVLRGR